MPGDEATNGDAAGGIAGNASMVRAGSDPADAIVDKLLG